MASFLGHGEIVRMLLDAGANPRINNYLLKATPVHKAAYAGRPDALVALRAEGGGEINAQGPYNGYTAMHDAVWHGHPDCLAIILDWPGARFDLVGFDGLTPEGLAKRLGYNKMARINSCQARVPGERNGPCVCLTAPTPASCPGRRPCSRAPWSSRCWLGNTPERKEHTVPVPEAQVLHGSDLFSAPDFPRLHGRRQSGL